MSRFNPSGVGKDAIDSILAKLNSLETTILARLDNLETGGGTTPTEPPPPTGVPNNVLNLTVSAVTETTASLTWTGVSKATRYIVELDGSFLQNVTENTVEISELVSGRVYNVVIKSANDNGEASGVMITVITAYTPTEPVNEAIYAWVGGVEVE